MQDLRIVFAGTPDNAAHTLNQLLEAGLNIVGVLTRSDASVGRKGVIRPSSVAKVAQDRNLPLWKTNHFDEQTRSWLRSRKADVGVIVAYGTILRSEDLEIPKLGWLNLHYSLLPELPGPAPVQHAIMQGKESTGVTIFSLDEGVDTGAILAQKEVSIDPALNSGDLLQVLTEAGSTLLIEVLEELESFLGNAKPQPKGSPGSIAYKPTRALGKLDFKKTAKSLSNLVRAMNPEPMAWFELDGISIRVHSAKPADLSGLNLSEAALLSKSVIVGCGENTALELLVVQPAGKKAMAASDWFRGLQKARVVLA